MRNSKKSPERRPQPCANSSKRCIKRLANVVVDVSEGNEDARYIPAFEALKGNANRHTFRHVVFTSKPTPADAFNLFRGLGVKPAPGDCSLVLQHVREVIAAGDAETSEGLLNLMAWQIQNIGEPSRTVVVMKLDRRASRQRRLA